ncbi:hypothetical protein EON65_41995 [archaeon]|nr:MAG: hypothetical protein EON65_41995 [archaeon]
MIAIDETFVAHINDFVNTSKDIKSSSLDLISPLPALTDKKMNDELQGKLSDVATYDRWTDSYFCMFYHPYYSGKGILHRTDGFSKEFQMSVKQRRQPANLHRFSDTIVEFITSIHESIHESIKIELILTPSSGLEKYNDVMKSFLEEIRTRLKDNNVVSS